MSPFEWCDEALEFGVVDTVEFGEPGFISFGVVFPTDLPSDLIGESDDVFDTFCWANRSLMKQSNENSINLDEWNNWKLVNSI